MNELGQRIEIECKKCKIPFGPSMKLKQLEKNELQNVPLPDACPKCKGQVCDKFRESGGICPFGDGCKFLHPEEFLKDGKPADDDPAAYDAGPRKHSYSCRYFAVGKCISGDKCMFKHDEKVPAEVVQ